MSTQQVSLLSSTTPPPASPAPLLLPLLLCTSLQSHIRRTIFPIIETSFRRCVRFVCFVRFPANLSVGQSDFLESRDLCRSLSLPLCIMSFPVVSQPASQSSIQPPVHSCSPQEASFECCAVLSIVASDSRRNCFFLPPLGQKIEARTIDDRRSNCANYRNLILSQILCKNK